MFRFPTNHYQQTSSPRVTGLVTGRRWQLEWGYVVCQSWTAASFPTRHNSPTQFWLPFFRLPLPRQQQCQKNEDAEEEQKELNMAEEGALLEELPVKCLPSSSCNFCPWWERSMLRATTGPQDMLQGEKRHFSTHSLPDSHCIGLPTKKQTAISIQKGVVRAACESSQGAVKYHLRGSLISLAWLAAQPLLLLSLSQGLELINATRYP